MNNTPGDGHCCSRARVNVCLALEAFAPPSSPSVSLVWVVRGWFAFSICDSSAVHRCLRLSVSSRLSLQFYFGVFREPGSFLFGDFLPVLFQSCCRSCLCQQAIAAACCRAILSDCEENALRALSVIVDLARVSSSRMAAAPVHSSRSPSHVAPSSSLSASPLPLAAELLSHTLPELYISVKAAIERQAEQCQTEGRAPRLGELPLGPLDRAKGQLVPATLSIRVTGDVAYCLLALCTRLPMMLVLLQHPQPLQKYVALVRSLSGLMRPL